VPEQFSHRGWREEFLLSFERVNMPRRTSIGPIIESSFWANV
jgi:hypothetical protein